MPRRAAAVLTTVLESSMGSSVAVVSPRTTASSLCSSFSIFSFASLRTFSYFSCPEENIQQIEVWAQRQSHLSWEAPLLSPDIILSVSRLGQVDAALPL